MTQDETVSAVALTPVERLEALMSELVEARRNRDVDINALIKLAQDVEVAQRAAQAFTFEQTRALLADAIKSAISAFDFTSLGVTKLSVAVDFTTEAPTVNIVPSGPSIKQTRAKSASTSNGSRARKTYTLDGIEYTSRTLVETFGNEVNETRTATVLEDPSKGLTHFADEIATKKGASVS